MDTKDWPLELSLDDHLPAMDIADWLDFNITYPFAHLGAAARQTTRSMNVSTENYSLMWSDIEERKSLKLLSIS